MVGRTNILVIAWVLAAVAHAAPMYRVTDLGTLGGTLSRAHALNSHGQVAGESETARGDLRGFYWSAETSMRDLGTLGGEVSRAYDLNDKGVVVGESETASGLPRPFRWKDGQGLTALGLPDDCSAGYAEGLNHFGRIVGGGDTPEGSRALLWTVDDVQPIEMSNRLSVAHDINDEGWVAGQTEEEGSVAAFLLLSDSASGGLSRITAHGESGCAALAVNATGRAAGYVVGADGKTRAAVMDAAGRVEQIDLVESSYSIAHAINARGDVVGSYIAGDGEDEHAFIHMGGEFYDLNDLIDEPDDWILVEARDINRDGWIAGYGLRGGEERAVLLVPDAGRSAQLPEVRIVEPSSGAAFEAGARIPLKAEAVSERGVRRVVFYANGQVVGASSEEPFECSWLGAPVGECDLLAVATDGQGRIRRSSRVRILVGMESLEPPGSRESDSAATPADEPYDPTAEPAAEELQLRLDVAR